MNSEGPRRKPENHEEIQTRSTTTGASASMARALRSLGSWVSTTPPVPSANATTIASMAEPRPGHLAHPGLCLGHLITGRRTKLVIQLSEVCIEGSSLSVSLELCCDGTLGKLGQRKT